jgi:hypothetical protein
MEDVKSELDNDFKSHDSIAVLSNERGKPFNMILVEESTAGILIKQLVLMQHLFRSFS